MSVLYPLTTAAGEAKLAPEGYVRVTWHAEVTSADMRILLLHALQLLLDSGCGRMLIDHRRDRLYSSADHTWLLTEWFPRAISHGPCRVAVLPSADVFVRTNTYLMAQQAYELFGVVSRYFGLEEEAPALAWLLQDSPTPPPSLS